MTKRIHLGLDLQGGAHLILQVQVKEAVSAETDSTVASDQAGPEDGATDLFAGIKPDPDKPEVIRSRGHAAGKASEVRSLLDQKYSNEYDVSAAADNTLTLTMKPHRREGSRAETVQQAIETIRDRVDTLGVSEPLMRRTASATTRSGRTARHQRSGSCEDHHPSTARLEIHPVVATARIPR